MHVGVVLYVELVRHERFGCFFPLVIQNRIRGDTTRVDPRHRPMEIVYWRAASFRDRAFALSLS